MMMSIKRAKKDKRKEMKNQKIESFKENTQLLRMTDESPIYRTLITEEREMTFKTDAQEKENVGNPLPTHITIQQPDSPGPYYR